MMPLELAIETIQNLSIRLTEKVPNETEIERVFIVCPQIYMKKINYVNYILRPISKVFVTSVTLPILLLLLWPIQKDSISQCVIYLVISFLCAVLSVYFVGLNKSEKQKAKTIVLKIKAKI